MVHINEPAEPRILPYGRSYPHEKHCQRPFPAPDRMRRLLQVKIEPAKPTRRPQPSAPTTLAGGVKKLAEPPELRVGKCIVMKVFGEVAMAAGVHTTTGT